MRKAENQFRKVRPQKLTNNFIQSIGDEWMLITAGTKDNFNIMTASWGAVGVLWNKPIAICFVRPTRYTFEFINRSEVFTLSFFDHKFRKILNYCGSRSGKKVDKIRETGLQPLVTKNNGIIFEQARLCIECKKIYTEDLIPEQFVNPDTDRKFYPKKDYHRMYIGEIITCYTR